jgi:hypothetical protein
VTVVGTRVLRAHIDGAKHALRDNLPGFLEGEVDGETLARRVAESVVTATDSNKTYYCVGVRLASGNTLIYGPLATAAAARKAIESGDVLGGPGARAGVFPLLPAGTI